MKDYDKTWRLARDSESSNRLSVTIFDGIRGPRTVRLDSSDKIEVFFGRGTSNDVVLTSRLMSGEHGRFQFRNGEWFMEDKEAYRHEASTNGLIYQRRSVSSMPVFEGDCVRIDDGIEAVPEGVLFLFTHGEAGSAWNALPTENREEITIGSNADCLISLCHAGVSPCHALIARDGLRWYIVNRGNRCKVLVNREEIPAKRELHEKDVIEIANAKIVFTSGTVYYSVVRNSASAVGEKRITASKNQPANGNVGAPEAGTKKGLEVATSPVSYVPEMRKLNPVISEEKKPIDPPELLRDRGETPHQAAEPERVAARESTSPETGAARERFQGVKTVFHNIATGASKIFGSLWVGIRNGVRGMGGAIAHASGSLIDWLMSLRGRQVILAVMLVSVFVVLLLALPGILMSLAYLLSTSATFLRNLAIFLIVIFIIRVLFFR